MLMSSSDIAAPIGAVHTDDLDQNLGRAGLRQTDLSHQLEMNNKKRHRLKTQSILLNGKANKSLHSLTDQQSVHSGGHPLQLGHSTDQLMHYPPQQQYYQQQVPMQMAPQQHQAYYGHGSPHAQYAYQQYPPQMHHPQQYQQQQHFQTRSNDTKQYRESYLYFDEGLEDQAQQQQQLHNEKYYQQQPQPQTRKFSYTGVIGTPMSTPPTEESPTLTKRLSFTQSITGLPMNTSTNTTTMEKSLEYMNSVDDDNSHTGADMYDTDDAAWVDMSPALNNNKLKLANRNLKKKLKDMELKYEVVSPNDIELENERLQLENEQLTKSISKLKLDALSSNDKLKEIDHFTKELITRLPNYINDKEIYLDIINGISLPTSLKPQLDRSLKTFDTKQNLSNASITAKHIEGTLTDDDLMKLLREDIRTLSSTVQRLSQEKSQIEKIYSKRLLEERKTIRMAAKHKLIHNEFRRSSHYKPNLIKDFKLIDPILYVDENNLKSVQSTPLIPHKEEQIKDRNSKMKSYRESSDSSSSLEQWQDASNVTKMGLTGSGIGGLTTATTTADEEEDNHDIESEVAKPILNSNGKWDSPKSLVYETFDS